MAGEFLDTPPEEVFVSWFTIHDNPHGLAFQPNRATVALETYVDATTRHLGFVFKPWTWLAAALAVLALGWRRRTSSRHADVVVALGASAAFYVVTYLLMVIGYDYRFVYWSALAVSVAAVLLLLDGRTARMQAAPARPSSRGGTS